MSSYAPVCNVKMLKNLIRKGITLNYLLLLAHDVAANEEAYEELTEMLGPECRIILDNSLIELGEAASLEVMFRAVTTVCPDYIVLPDVLQDTDASVQAFENSYGDWLTLLDYSNETSLMAVIQGKNFVELEECIRRYQDLDVENAVGLWGVPRIVGTTLGSRETSVRRLTDMGKKVHLLGFSSHFIDDMRCARLPGVLGIDSATPLRLGQERIQLNIANGENLEDRCRVSRDSFFREAIFPSVATLYNLNYIEAILNASSSYYLPSIL